MTLVAGIASLPDLLRLLAIPVFVWAAYRDVRTRRVPNRIWLPLAALGVIALVVDARTVMTQPPIWRALFFRQVLLSVGLLVPAAYLLWWIGGFGGADAKALMVIAVVYPTYPVFYGNGFALPLVRSAAGLFSLTILTNAVIIGAAYPLALALRNGLAGRVHLRSFVGLPVPTESLETRYGRLLEDPNGFSRRGLDLDALRMYLRWRGETLASIRADPDRRNPTTLPDAPNDPTDGAVAADPRPTRTLESVEGDAPTLEDDPWGADRFLNNIDHDAYGTSAEQLRAGLDLIVDRDRVWISPGIPFIVPITLGLIVAAVYGDLLVGVLGLFGLV